jgi:hypothetical protein
VDISARVVAGVLVPGFNLYPNNAIGDGVNKNEMPLQETFPYVGWAQKWAGSPAQRPGDLACGVPPFYGYPVK